MRRIFILFSFLGFAIEFVSGQQTQADVEKKMKEAQEMMKKYGNDTAINKMMKNMQSQQKQVMDAMENKPANNNATNTSSFAADPSEYSNVDNWKFPAKNAAMLSSLPKRIFTKPELVNFLNDTYLQLSKKLPAGISSSVQSIAAKYNNDGSKMGDAAVKGWYTDYREESLLLIIKAAANNPDDGLLLNNCAAILNLGGIEQRAIPILKYLLQFNTGSSMVLNNLGQAYAGLGETDTAMVYLGRSIKIEPENPEANNTAGQIEAAKGNTEKAIGYFEQSIRGAYNKPAELKLRKIKENSNIVPLVRPRVKIPEYFNQFKYKLPAQCTSTNNAAVTEAEYVAFRAMIVTQIQKYGGKIAELQIRESQNPLTAIKFKKDDFGAHPFREFCGIMAGKVRIELTDGWSQYDKKYFTDYANLEKEYNTKLEALRKASAGDPCKAENDLANQYLPKYAMLTEDFQEKNQDFFKRLFDEVIYWGYLHLHPLGDDYFRKECYYQVIIGYLGMLGKVATTKIIEPCDFEHTTATADSNVIKDYDCPIDFELGFGPGKIQLNCEKFSITGGEGLVFGYEKKFKTHQSTVSVGIGLTLELQEKVGPLKAGAKATASETVFITFDGNNGIADAGLKNEAKLSASAPGVGKKEVSVGSTLGIQSGYNFAPGPFKGIGDPKPEVQINKNIPVYKPNN